jgi:hypothetical protein
MTAVTQQPEVLRRGTKPWSERLLVPEMWATLAISVMWLAVLFDGVYGSEIVSTNGDGPYTTTIPSAVVVAFFAFLGTSAVAKRAFGRKNETDQITGAAVASQNTSPATTR